MANLEKNIEEKLTEVFKGEFEKEDCFHSIPLKRFQA